MKQVFAAIVLAIAPVAAAAQGYLGDPGQGFKLGVEMLNNSGEIGSATFFRRGVNRTQIVVNMDGVPGGRVQSVKLYRGQDCTDVAKSPENVPLADLKGRSSTSMVPLSPERLLSGNYNIIVFSSNKAGAQSVACGHLYH